MFVYGRRFSAISALRIELAIHSFCQQFEDPDLVTRLWDWRKRKLSDTAENTMNSKLCKVRSARLVTKPEKSM